MFEYVSTQRSSWFVPFIAQLVLATIGPLLLLMAVASLFRMYQASPAFDNALLYLTVVIIAFPVGFGIARVFPRLVMSGKWIWVVPACLLLVAWVDELWINARPPYGYHSFRSTMA